jgi:CHAD domain-containing protein
MTEKRQQPEIRYAGLYDGDTPSLQACSVILGHLLALIDMNTPGCLAAAGSLHLHDVRVAFRRLRSAISFFSPLLIKVNHKKLERFLRRLCSDLGQMRDLQSRVELLDKLSCGPDLNCAAYRRKCMADLKTGMKNLKLIVSGAGWKECISLTSELSRNCRLEATGTSVAMRQFAPLRLKKRFAGFRRRDFGGVLGKKPESLHALRKRFRRLRYYVEISAPALGIRAARLEGLLLRITGLLGEIHDIDVCLAHDSGSGRYALGPQLEKHFRNSRITALKELAKALKKAELVIQNKNDCLGLMSKPAR